MESLTFAAFFFCFFDSTLAMVYISAAEEFLVNGGGRQERGDRQVKPVEIARHGHGESFVDIYHCHWYTNANALTISFCFTKIIDSIDVFMNVEWKITKILSKVKSLFTFSSSSSRRFCMTSDLNSEAGKCIGLGQILAEFQMHINYHFGLILETIWKKISKGVTGVILCLLYEIRCIEI